MRVKIFWLQNVLQKLFFFFCSKFWFGQLPGSCVFYSQNLSKKLGVKIYEFGQSFWSHWTIFRKYVFEQKNIFFFTQNFRTGRFFGILQIIWENLGLKNIFFDDVFVNFEQQKQLLKKLRKVSSKNDTQYILTPIKKEKAKKNNEAHVSIIISFFLL